MKMSEIPNDALYDALKTVPARPTISNIQWIMGTQYLSPADLNLLSNSPIRWRHTDGSIVGGPDRPLSKSQAAQQYAQDRQRALVERAARRSNTADSQTSSASQQGVFAQMSQAMNERGVRLEGVQETFNSIGETTSEWFNSLSKAAEDQKRKALFSSVTGKLNPF
jgi:syntaxin-binding protein 5